MEKTPTTQARVGLYEKVNSVFKNLLSEIRELSKKKPDMVMSKSKVSLINRVLDDVKLVVIDEPQAAYLELLDDEQLPQNSDALLMMVQYEAALAAFKLHHYNHKRYRWIFSDEDA